MKRALLLIFLLCIAVAARAEQLSQEEVVRTLISAAHKDQLRRFLAMSDLARIASHPRHSHSPEALLKLLKKIPEAELSLESHPDTATKTTLVRLTAPLRLDFSLEYRPPQTRDTEEGSYVVVSVTP